MKLLTVLLLLTIFQSFAKVDAQMLTLDMHHAALKDVLTEIRKQTGYSFVMSSEMPSNIQKVSIHVSNMPLENALKQIFRNQPFDFRIEEKTILLRGKEETVLAREAEEINADNRVWTYTEVRGQVVDSLGKPLEGASIRVINADGKRTTLQTLTDRNGKFALGNVPEEAFLEISYVGFSTKKIKAALHMGQIVLQALPATLTEVTINAGYYQVKDRERTGSISRVTAEDIGKQPVLNPLGALIGRMPGVSITQASGVPGGGFTIEVRGRNTMTAVGNPLYIVDGVPFEGDNLGSANVGGLIFGISQAVSGISTYGLSPLNGINPSDIESIEVLKDADATAIYGSRGANGVVLITTKRARADRSTVSIRYTRGMGKAPRRLRMLDTKSYLEMRKEAYANDGIVEYPNGAYDINGTWDQTRYTDWQEALVGGTATQDNFHGSLSGGNKITQFIIGGGYMRETSVYPGDYHNDKISVRTGLNHQSENQKLTISTTVNYVVDKNDFPGQDLNYYAVRLAPNAPALFNEDGSLNWANGTWNNPLAYREQNYRSKLDNLIANTVLGYTLFKGLELKASLGFNNVQMDETRTNPSTFYNPAHGLGPESSAIFLSTSSKQSWIMEPQISYHTRLSADWEIKALVGATFQEKKDNFFDQYAYGFTSNSLLYDIKSATGQAILNSNESAYRYGAVFGRLNLNWKERYFINLTGRRDGSSRFGPGRQFANFGAVGVSWIFSESKLVREQLPFVQFGKLRGSYGITGSDNIGDYKFLDTYSSTGLSYQGIKGLAPTGLFNPNFAWESNTKGEVALELGMLDNRLNVSTGYYFNRSSNQLVGIPLSAVTGFTSIQANLGATVQNTGWELEFHTVNMRTSSFSWQSSFNITVPRNKLVDFPGLETSTYANRYVIGEPLNIVKVYNFLGVDPETGIYRFEDVNGDGLLNTEDRQSVGRIHQTYYGGLNNSFSIGKFHLDVFFQFVKQTGRNYVYTMGMPGLIGNQPREVMQRWRNPGDDTMIQRFSAGQEAYTAYNNLFRSVGAYSDASFVRLKNVMLSYDLSTKAGKGVHGRLFMQGQNLLTFTQHRGVDPETNSTANAALPPLRMITFGFELNF